METGAANVNLQVKISNRQILQIALPIAVSILVPQVNFLCIRIWGLPLLYMYQLRNAVLVGTNNSRFLVIGTLVETLTNIVLDYALITGKLGFHKIGFNGAAIASIIAEAAGFLTVF